MCIYLNTTIIPTHRIQLLLVLSDGNKRFLYDVGVYDSDDENDENVSSDAYVW